ncbi:hypothetical protein G6F49_001936 [Rhizopus delemar]|nr:hypothetical protein G6F49_001936 [Rhizopus delemar]KAG1645542.1 hypothetical protein G6F44_001733 [Rhizopus delemar]
MGLRNIRNDLRNATLKELTDCLRSINESLRGQAKLILSGRKEEVIDRLANFTVSLIASNKRSSVAAIVAIVNNKASRRFSRSATVKVPIQEPVTATSQNYDEAQFKCNSFFEPVSRITNIQLAPASYERMSKFFHFTLSNEHYKLLATPNGSDDQPVYQIRFFCSKLNNASSVKDMLIEFPSACEIRMNGNVIGGASLRGIKNRPGTVNPPDLTVMTKKQSFNNVELVYYNTDSPYIAGIYIVRRIPIPALINTMKERRIPKEMTLKKLQEKQEEDDIVLESETLSMKCPLAFVRIVTPIRSIHCNHLQCFDANTFLVMNEQTPTWSCPVCYKKIDSCDDLVLDGYFLEILNDTPSHIDSVKVETDGQITLINESSSPGDESDAEEEESKNKEETVVELLDDDDNNNSIPNNKNLLKRSREDDNSILTNDDIQPQQNYLKKQRQDVIDLTLSSDDEDESER